MGSGVCKWGFYGVRSSTTAHYVCQPSSAGCGRVLSLVPPVVSHSLQYFLFFRERTSTPLRSLLPSVLSSWRRQSKDKATESGCNSYLQHGSGWVQARCSFYSGIKIVFTCETTCERNHLVCSASTKIRIPVSVNEMLCNALWWWSWGMKRGWRAGHVLFFIFTHQRGTQTDMTKHQPSTNEHLRGVAVLTLHPKVISCFSKLWLVYICLVHSHHRIFHLIALYIMYGGNGTKPHLFLSADI